VELILLFVSGLLMALGLLIWGLVGLGNKRRRGLLPFLLGLLALVGFGIGAVTVLPGIGKNTSAGSSGSSTSVATTPITIAMPAANSSVSGNSFVLAGSAAPNSELELFDGPTSLGKITTDASGAWSFAVAGVSLGAHDYQLLPLGVSTVSGPRLALTATADGLNFGAITTATATMPPAGTAAAPLTTITAPITGQTQAGNAITLAGAGVAGTELELFDGPTSLGKVMVDPNGAWTLPITGITPGDHVYEALPLGAAAGTGPKLAIAATAAGLTVGANTSMMATTPNTPASTPTITERAPDTNAKPLAMTTPASDVALGDSIIEGTGTPGDEIEVLDGETPVGKTVVLPDGSWSLAVKFEQAGPRSLRARTTGELDTLPVVFTAKADMQEKCPCALRVEALALNASIQLLQNGQVVEQASGPIKVFRNLSASSYGVRVEAAGFAPYNSPSDKFNPPTNKNIKVFMNKAPR
jgi:hypothetical protein